MAVPVLAFDNDRVRFRPVSLCCPLHPLRSTGMDGLHGKDIEAEKGMVRGYVQQYAREIAMLLAKVDRQLILLFKTNDCLR